MNRNSPSASSLERRGDERPLFVGHTNSGAVVVAAQHNDAMHGMAVLADDIEVTAADVAAGREMWCQRETPTGTHVPQWICRFSDETAAASAKDQARARNFLFSLPRNCTDNCPNH
jgi:hypothetical protein